MKELGRGKKRLQHNIVDLYPGLPTPDRWSLQGGWTKTHTHTHDDSKYKLEWAKCKRLVHYGCTSLPTYQLQLFLTKGYQKFICCKCIEIHSYLYAISFSQNKAHLKKKKKKENSGSKKKDSLRPVLLRNWKENSGSKKKDSLRSVLLRNWKENSGSKKKDWILL